MVITLTKQQVARIMAFAGAILPRKASVPALARALFGPGGDGLKVALTDLEQTLAISLRPERLQGAPARFLFPVAELKTLKADTVTLQPMAEDAVVCTAASGGRALARTVTVPPVAEFPELPNPGELAECNLGAFLRAYRGTAFAAHSDPGRRALRAVYAGPERPVRVATDGHRPVLRPPPVRPHLLGGAFLCLYVLGAEQESVRYGSLSCSARIARKWHRTATIFGPGKGPKTTTVRQRSGLGAPGGSLSP